MSRIGLLAGALALALTTHAQADATESDATKKDAARVQILGFNDFHGGLVAGRTLRGRPVGGAAVLAAYLRDATRRFEGGTLLVHAGDHVGASPPASGLLQDEPSIAFLNLLANRFCSPTARMDPRCDVVGTLGNHEFDEGITELLRLAHGGNAARGPFLDRPYRGTHFPLVSANVVWKASGRPVLAPYVVKRVGGVRVGVIGAVVSATPSMVVASGVNRVRFLPEADAINRAVRALVARGVEAIVVTIHQGGQQPFYEGPTRDDVAGPGGDIAAIVTELDDAVDVVISGHAHAFTNARMATRRGKRILVTQALSSGMAFAQVTLAVHRGSGDVLEAIATIVPTWADAGPGLTPAEDVAALVARAEQRVAPMTQRVIGHAPHAVSEAPNASGESALGNLIADAQRSAVGAQIAFMNQGGIRTGIEAGDVTWGDLFAVHPFGNTLVTMDLTGAQIRRALEQQWQSDPPRLMQVSGLSYVWDPTRVPGSRIVSVEVGGVKLADDARYRVVANSFVAEGGGEFPVFREGTRREGGPLDVDVLADYLAAQRVPVAPQIEGRIRTR